MTKAQVIAKLKKAQGDRSQQQYARDLGVSPAYISDVYSGRRNPGPAILNAMGLRKTEVVVFSPRRA